MRERIELPDLEMCILEPSRKQIFRRLRSANDFAQIARVALSEQSFLETSVLKWLLSAPEISKKLRDETLAIYGLFAGHNLAGFMFVRAVAINNILELAMCCIHPNYRSQYVGENLSVAMAITADQTNAFVTFADAICMHNQVQKGLEKSGFIPFGFLPLFETFGSDSDEHNNQHTLIRYIRFPHGDASLWLTQMSKAQLTQKSERVLAAILELLEEQYSSQNLVSLPLKKAG